MKRLFVAGLLFVFMAVMPLFHAVADNNQCRNLFDGEYISVSDGVKAENKNPFYVTPGKKYTISWSVSAPIAVNLYAYDSNNTLLYSWASSTRSSPYFSDNHAAWYNGATFTVPENVVRLRFNTFSTMSAAQQASWAASLQIEEGDTATEYTPYNPLCATCNGQIENYVSATGTVAQNGTPSPTNPIEPVFYKQGNMILRKVGNYADSYDATTGKITRRIGVKVLDGTEDWYIPTTPGYSMDGATTFWNVGAIQDNLSVLSGPAIGISNYLINAPQASATVNPKIANSFSIGSNAHSRHTLWMRIEGEKTVAEWKQWLAQQYAAGTPVVVYYPLATETTENWNETTYCAPNIKIATTAYNAARFSPVKTDLNNAVATIREIVTKTINQTAAIASLQADKQTRPEDACPAGKKCLLVETEENGVVVPHWFPIIEAPE